MSTRRTPQPEPPDNLPPLPALPDGARGWAVYARLSAPKIGPKKQRRNESETVERQITEIRAFAADRAMMIDNRHIYVDNLLSAWDRNGKRPAFDQMISAALRGEFAGILVWKLDRFTRRTSDALWFIDLYEKHHTMINGPMSGEYDMSTPDGRRKLRDDASEAEHESDTTGARVRSFFEKARMEGLMWGGGRIFGFEKLSEAREYDDDVFPIQKPAEAAVIREVARRALDGEPWQRIADDLNERGVTTAKRKPWHATNLALMISKPYYGGYITYGGEIIGKLETVPGPGGGKVPYTPILDAETYARIQALRASQKRGRQPGNDYKLTGAVTCGRCGRTMAGGTRGKKELADEELRRRYVCPVKARGAGRPGCGTSISAVIVENLVRDKVLEATADPDVRAVITEGDRAQDAARDELRRQLADAETEIGQLNAEISALELRRIKARRPRDRTFEELIASIEKMIAEEQARRHEYLAELGDDSNRPGGGVRPVTAKEWKEMNGEEQRDLIRQLDLTITVFPVFPGMSRKVFDPRRVVVE